MTDALEVARACRVLAHLALVEDILGHVSLRTGEDRLLVRCRGPRESGLMYTRPEDVRAVQLRTGRLESSDEYRAPNELPIHLAVMRARPDVAAVVHAHPPSVVLGTVAGLDLAPVYGAYDIPGTRLAIDGVPVIEHMGLINDEDSAAALVDRLGTARACLLRGHGLVAVGASVQEAVAVAHAVDTLYRFRLDLARLGCQPPTLSATDLEHLPDLGPDFNIAQLWRYWRAELGSRDLRDPCPEPEPSLTTRDATDPGRHADPHTETERGDDV